VGRDRTVGSRERARYERANHEHRPVTELYVVDNGVVPDDDRLDVVLVHGSMDRSGSWVRVVRELRPDARRVVRYDRRGYGRSRPLGPGTMAQHIDDLLAVVGDRPAVVAGHSYGAAVALAAAQRRPDVVRGVVSFEGPMSWRPWWPGRSAGGTAVQEVRDGSAMGDAAERFLRRMIGDAKWESLPARTREERRAEGEALLTELMSARDDGPPYDPARITVPVVSSRGTDSDEHLRRGADVLAEEIPGCELVVLEGADHGAHQSHAADFADLIRVVGSRAEACTGGR
jgi:pimeloyl-ACP methyl ester carboxylesterase